MIKVLDDDNFAYDIFIDLWKDFDAVDYNILLSKLFAIMKYVD